VAVLDRRFAAEVTRYPEITASLFDRLSERSLRLATTQAISQLTRVDRRLKALFWHLAERWGRVSGDGVIVPLALTHRILGQLVGARRPTVSTALSELAEREELVRRPDGSWLLRGDPPDAESLARKPSSASSAAARTQDLLRPARRFDRGEPGSTAGAGTSGEVIAAIDRLREALEPGQLRELLARRRQGEADDDPEVA
jgi:CRP/FNR family cyclic AMP-dependent transcriptional regulator